MAMAPVIKHTAKQSKFHVQYYSRYVLYENIHIYLHVLYIMNNKVTKVYI
jgi:hypothetical protein